MGMDYHSARREATWTGTRGDTAVLVIANTGGEAAKVALASSSGSRTVMVDPYQAQVVRLDAPADAGKQAMWAVLDSSSVPGDLRVTGFVAAAKGAPRLIRFYDPSAVKQPHLYATRMRVANARGDLALKNTSALPVTAHAAFLDSETGQPLFELTPVTLGPNAARTVDLRAAMASLAGSASSDAVAVRVESNGPAGALIGSLYVEDRPTGTLFDVPLRDSGTARSSTGSYPWRLDGDYETRVVDHQCRRGAGEVRGAHRVRRRRAGAGSARAGGGRVGHVRSARVARPAAMKDGTGRTLARGTDHGRFIWSVYGGGQSARLVGRAEVISARRGVSSSYSCGQCCPDSFVVGDISPFQQTVGVAGNASYTVTIRQNCYGQQYQMNIWAGSWNVDIPSVASVATQTYGVGRLSGNAAGETPLAGTGAPNGGRPTSKIASSTRSE